MHFLPSIEFAGLSFQPGMIREIMSRKYSVIIFQGDFTNLTVWFSLLLGRFISNSPSLLLWTHGWTRQDRRPRGTLKRVFFGLSDGLLLYADRAADLGRKSIRESLPLHVVGNSLSDLTPLTSDKEEEIFNILPRDMSKVKIIVVTRLIAERNLDELFDACLLLAGRGVTVELTVVGDGDSKESLNRTANLMGIRAHFLGAIYEEQTLATLYESNHLSVITGPAGLALASSLSHGLPAIIHDDLANHMPEASALQPGVNGELYSRGSSIDLADQIEKTWRGINEGRYSRAICIESAISSFSPKSHAERIIDAIKISMPSGH